MSTSCGTAGIPEDGKRGLRNLVGSAEYARLGAQNRKPRKINLVTAVRLCMVNASGDDEVIWKRRA